MGQGFGLKRRVAPGEWFRVPRFPKELPNIFRALERKDGSVIFRLHAVEAGRRLS